MVNDMSSNIEELTRKEISAVESGDKLSKLEREASKNKRLIDGYKEREKTSARALVLYERKIRYIRESFSKDILNLCAELDQANSELERIIDESRKSEFTERLRTVIEDFYACQDEMSEIGNRLESVSVITKKDRDFISNTVTKPEPTLSDLDARFEKLKKEFEQKIGASAYRKRGRPRKEDQSIVSDIGLGKKLEKQVEDTEEVEEKINDLFYSSPKNSGAMSDIPQTNDSVFDFNEALNPDISLKDIMDQIMTGNPDEEEEELETTQNTDYLYNDFDEKTKQEMLESGFIHKPNLKSRDKQVRSLDNTGNGLKNR